MTITYLKIEGRLLSAPNSVGYRVLLDGELIGRTFRDDGNLWRTDRGVWKWPSRKAAAQELVRRHERGVQP